MKFRNQGEQFTVGLCPAEYVGEFPERGKNRLDTSEPGVGGEYARFLRCGGAFSKRNISRIASILSLRCAFLL